MFTYDICGISMLIAASINARHLSQLFVITQLTSSIEAQNVPWSSAEALWSTLR